MKQEHYDDEKKNVLMEARVFYTYHTNCGQPHTIRERLKKCKIINGRLPRFLHDETQAEIHERFTEIYVLFS